MLTLPGPYWGPLPNLGPDPKNLFYDSYYNSSEFKSFPRTGINENMLNQLRGPIPTDFSNKSNPNLKGLSPEQLYKQILSYIIQSQNDRAYMANLAGQVALIDYNVGKVMNALKNTGLDNNTHL